MNNLSYYLARIYYALTRNTTSVIPSGDQESWWAERIYRHLAGFPDRMSGGKNASFWLELAFYNKTNQAYRQATGTMPAWFWLSKLYAYYAGNATDSILQPANAAFWADKLASIPNLGGLPEITLTVNGQNKENGQTFTPSNPIIGTTVQYTVTATNGGTATLTLANATRSGAVTVVSAWSSTTLIPGASATCTITLDTASSGAQTGYFEFTTNDFTGGEDTYRVNASYTVLVQNIKVTLGVIQVTAGGSYAAGEYDESAVAQVTCTVENIGDALLTIQNPTVDGHVVSASAFSDLTLNPAQSVTSTITLNTATSILTVARSGNIHIASDDPDTPSFDVQINFNANPVWLLNDEFSSGNANSPRSATPGPGSWVIGGADAAAQFSVSGDNWQVAGGAPVTAFKSASAGIARAAGLLYSMIHPGQVAGASVFGFGANNTTRPIQSAFTLATVDKLALRRNGGSAFDLNIPISTVGRLYIVLRSTGAYYIAVVSGVAGVVWVGATDTQTPIYPGMGFASASPSAYGYSDERVRQLANEWLNANPIATTVLSGARSASDTFTHEADAIIEWIETTLPTALNTLLDCWQQDVDNKWEISISDVGTISLTEIVATIPTVRGTSVAVVANGHRIVVKRNTTTIRIYSGAAGSEVLRITYASASNFQSATNGVLAALGTGGAVSDIIANPVAIPANALAELVKGL